MHDDTQVQRAFLMHQAIQAGMFPVRWVNELGFGYGYPIFNFYAPFAYYIGAGIMSLGWNALDATKLMMGLAMGCAGITMFLLGRELFGKWGGVVAGVAYALASYHGVNLYVRGAVAELWAYCWIPLALWSLYRLSRSQTMRMTVVTAISLSLVMISHNLSVLLMIPMLSIWWLWIFLTLSQKRRFLLYSSGAVLLAALLSSWYILPVFGEMRYTNVFSQIGGGADFREHFVCLSQLWYSPWGYGGSVPNSCIDGMSFQIGRVALVLSLLGALSLVLRKAAPMRSYGGIIILLIGVSVYLTTDASRWFWELQYGIGFIQYPWRFLLFVHLWLSLLAGLLVWVISQYLTRSWMKSLLCIFLTGGLIVNSYRFFEPQFIYPVDSATLTDSSFIRHEVSSRSSEYLPASFFIDGEEGIEPVRGGWIQTEDAKILDSRDLVWKKQAEVEGADGAIAYIYVAPYPAWNVTIVPPAPVIQESNGYRVELSKGKYTVKMEYVPTLIQSVSHMATLTGVMLAAGAILYEQRKRYARHAS
jgi:hypothetical protein